jgi:hypothetical protein
MIFWKQVGQVIVEPACEESHLMCWLHTGQAYLNSLMLSKTFHIWPPAATWILPGRGPAGACFRQEICGNGA